MRHRHTWTNQQPSDPPFGSSASERFSVGDDGGELASGDLTDARELVEVERSAVDFAVKAVTWDAGFDSGFLLCQSGLLDGGLYRLTKLLRGNIHNLLHSKPSMFYK